jgi:hypothetical protein
MAAGKCCSGAALQDDQGKIAGLAILRNRAHSVSLNTSLERSRITALSLDTDPIGTGIQVRLWVPIRTSDGLPISWSIESQAFFDAVSLWPKIPSNAA